MSRYFLILLACVFVTLPLEIVFKAKVYARLNMALKAIWLPSLAYLVWDVIATHYEHWQFSKAHSSNLRIIGLPVEEILFFLIIPICALLTYESVSNLSFKFQSLNQRKNAKLWEWITFVSLYSLFGISLYVFRLNNADFNVPTRNFPYYACISVAAILCLVFFYRKDKTAISIIKSRSYFLTIVICLSFMVVVNGALTVLNDPVVSYTSNLGPRLFIDIPIEDFFYGTALMTWIIIRFHKYTRPESRVIAGEH